MKIKLPEPFTFKAGKRAVLLLHGFTGHSADVRMVGRFLEKHGYTSHAPIYRGHGTSPEELLKTTPSEWWEDVLEGYNYLVDEGYEEISVVGLSFGGVLGLKLAYSSKVKAIIPMCTPAFYDNEKELTSGFKDFARQFKQFERKDEETIAAEVAALFPEKSNTFKEIGQFITEVRSQIDTIYAPTFVVQATNDEMINPESANYIYEHVEAIQKDIKWYEESGHVITLDKERDQLHEDILTFLQSLDWSEDE